VPRQYDDQLIAEFISAQIACQEEKGQRSPASVELDQHPIANTGRT
jgi:hypothetical protein